MSVDSPAPQGVENREPARPEVVPYYPVHVEGRLDAPLSRWLWLVKWVLVVPHVIVLAFLWIGFVVSWLCALVAIVVTGRYPRALFDYNVGVLRWTWRVQYYAYNALGTDRYPPFTLADVPDYPARFDVDPPQQLSRGLALVKWWLLAIPHYIVVGVFVGGGAWLGSRDNGGSWNWNWGAGGIVGILVLVSAVVLMVTGGYPRTLFDVVLGMNRWALRVGAYAALMTDAYPPFRLDLGPTEHPQAPSPTPSTGEATTGAAPAAQAQPYHGRGRYGWTGGRVASLIAGAIALFVGVGLLVGGLAVTVADHVSRDANGYLTSPTRTLSAGGYALTTDRVALDANGPSWAYPSAVLGTVRVRVDQAGGQAGVSRPVFVGIGRTSDVDAYLAGVQHSVLRSFSGNGYSGTGSDGSGVPADATAYTEVTGTRLPSTPDRAGIWAASASGTGTQVLTWAPRSGDWTVVVMNGDASRGVTVTADVGATVPGLAWVSFGLLVAGVLLLVTGVLLVALPVRAASRTAPQPVEPPVPA